MKYNSKKILTDKETEALILYNIRRLESLLTSCVKPSKLEIMGYLDRIKYLVHSLPKDWLA